MLTQVNKFLSKARASVKTGLSDKQGQVAIALILICAMALVTFAVTLNLGRVSMKKNVTTLAANQAAAKLGSLMASYGESVFRVSLGGDEEVCGLGGILGMIIAIIIIIICIATGQFAQGAMTVMAYVALTLAIIGAIMHMLVIEPGLTALWNKMQRSMSMEDQFVEQGIATALRAAVTDNVTVPDIFDADMDGNWEGRPDGAGPNDDQISRFAHFYTRRMMSIYENRRDDVHKFLKGLKDFVYRTDGVDVSGAFVDVDPAYPKGIAPNIEYPFHNKGLYDPLSFECSRVMSCPAGPAAACATRSLCDSSPAPPHVCCNVGNPCCLPADHHLRPDTCDIPRDSAECADIPGCNTADYGTGVDQAPYDTNRPINWLSKYCANGPHDWPYNYDYDPYADNYLNGDDVLSTSEQLGRDDEHRRYRKREPIPNEWQSEFCTDLPGDMSLPQCVDPHSSLAMGQIEQLQKDPSATDWTQFSRFEWKDATDYYDKDEKSGLFDFLWAVSEGGLDLSWLKLAGNPTMTNEEGLPAYRNQLQCHWCAKGQWGSVDMTGTGCEVMDDDFIEKINPNRTTTRSFGLEEGVDVNNNPTGAPLGDFSGGWCVEGRENHIGLSGRDAQPVDFVPGIKFESRDANGVPVYENIVMEDQQCSWTNVESREGTNTVWRPGWKKGADRYCATRDDTGFAEFPYDLQCTKWNNGNLEADVDCVPNGNATQFSEDLLDDFIYNVREFLFDAEKVMSIPRQEVASTFVHWYDRHMRDWVAPHCSQCPEISKCLDDACPSGDQSCLDGAAPDCDDILTITEDCSAACTEKLNTCLAACPIGGTGHGGRLNSAQRCQNDCQTKYGDMFQSVYGRTGSSCAEACEKKARMDHGDMCTVYCNPFREGKLRIWRDQLFEPWALALRKWLTDSYVGGFCAPSRTEVSKHEECFIEQDEDADCEGKTDSQGNSIFSCNDYALPHCDGAGDEDFDTRTGSKSDRVWGNVDDVVSCLSYNSANKVKFDKCSSQCMLGFCDSSFADIAYAPDIMPAAMDHGNIFLPRSLLPDFNPIVDFEQPDYAAYYESQKEIERFAQQLTDKGGLACECDTVSDPASFTEDCEYKDSDGNNDEDLVADLDNICAELKILEDNVKDSMGSCDTDPLDADKFSNPDGSGGLVTYLELIDLSAINAVNFDEKVKKRLDFLAPLVIQAKAAYEIFNSTFEMFDDFLRFPVGQLFNALVDAELGSDVSPFYAVYGWQSPSPEDNPNKAGNWHIVRVDARIPYRCNESCAVGATKIGQGDPAWPYVKRKTKFHKVCYYLKGKTGLVMARVIRWDEGGKKAIPFMNSAMEGIWKKRYSHPAANGPESSGALKERCSSSEREGNAGFADPEFDQFDAFMLNSPQEHPACWQHIHENLLPRGMVSESCVQYYFAGEGIGFRMKFVDCPPFAWQQWTPDNEVEVLDPEDK
ncbi:MAG: hypothetical protein GY861_23845 [bacterium]|nr:hypothetical protein [bacterium]